VLGRRLLGWRLLELIHAAAWEGGSSLFVLGSLPPPRSA
jgi:hypothetical protein